MPTYHNGYSAWYTQPLFMQYIQHTQGTHTHTHTHTHEQYTQCIENTRIHTHTYPGLCRHTSIYSREAMGRYISFSYGEIKYRTRERDEKKMKRKRRMKERKE